MDSKITDVVGITLSSIFTAVQTNDVFRIISLVLTILTTCVVLGRNIYEWYVEAKKDGKITPDELKKGVDIAQDGIKDIIDIVGKNKEGKDE